MAYVLDTFSQYRDVLQTPCQPESRSTTWTYGRPRSSQHSFTTMDDGYHQPQRLEDEYARTQTMQRFLVDASPLTSGMLHAGLNHGVHYQRQNLSLYPTPEYARHDSPDRTSTSGNSGYVTGNEARSPQALPIAYGSPGDYVHSSSPYPIMDQAKQDLYTLDTDNSGGSVNMRDLELYDAYTDLEVTVDEIHNTETKTELDDGTYEPDPDYLRPAAGLTEDCKASPCSTTSHTLRDAESVQPMDLSEGESSDADYSPRSTRRRRSSASTNGSGRQDRNRCRPRSGRRVCSTAQTPSNRVAKRGGRALAKTSGDLLIVDAQKHFPCPLTMYGCPSTFSSKNEWKRHVNTQHIKLGFWRCDLCAITIDPHDPQSVYHNDFNRKDLFTQHLRRMHAAPPNQSHRSQKGYPVSEDNIAEHQQRCFQILRETPDRSSCLYCDESFTGLNSWENRMEHIGRHLEKDRKLGRLIGHVTTWNIDKELERWLLHEGIIAIDKAGGWKIGDGRPIRQGMAEGHASDDDV